MPSLENQIAARIKALAGQKHVTIEKLAIDTDTSVSNLYKFLNGKRSITLKTLERLAKGLGVTVKELMP